MRTFLKTIGFGLIAGALLSGCNNDSTTTADMTEGTLVDSKLIGVAYACDPSGTNGKTDENGKFDYTVGDECSFSIGGLSLGLVEMTKKDIVVTPLDLVGSTDINDSDVIAMAVLLQSLDADKNPSNGIDVSNHAEDFADANETFEAIADDIAGFLKGELDENITVVTKEEAINHLKQTLIQYKIIDDGDEDNATDGNTTDNNSTGGESVLTCDTSKFAAGVPVAKPTNTDLLAFAFVYAADEGTFDDNFNFTASKQTMITLDVTGKLTYGASTYPTTSACVETLSSGAKQLVLHTQKGHLDFGSDKISVNGISPADGVTIVRTHTEDNGGGDDDNTTSSTEGVTIPSGKIIGNSNVTYVAMPLVGPSAKIITFTEGTAKIEVYDYTDTLSITVADSNPLMTIQTKTTYGSCYVAQNEKVNADIPLCSAIGIDFDRSAGTVTFTNHPMKTIVGSCSGECTINGSLNFTGYNN